MSKYNNGCSTIDVISIQSLYSKFVKNRLYLRPVLKDGRRTFQRDPHWKRDKKIYLMFSIMKGSTLPPIYGFEDPNDDAILNIVDGQQRLSAIFEFMLGELKLSKSGMFKQGVDTLDDEMDGISWSDLTPEQKKAFQNYSIRIEKLNDPDSQDFHKEVHNQFHRLNSTSGGMTAMEIMNNALSGDFVDLAFNIREALGFIPPGWKDLKISEESLENYFLLENSVVSKTEVLRMQDLALIIGLLVAMKEDGPLHKDEMVEQTCNDLKKMDKKLITALFDGFQENIKIIKALGESMPSLFFSSTNLRKKHDFYSLFCAVNDLRLTHGTTSNDDFTTEGHNLEVFELALKSYSEYILDSKRKTVVEWEKANISAKLRKDIPSYFNSRTRDWNHLSSRVIRRDLLLEVLQRSNKMPTP